MNIEKEILDAFILQDRNRKGYISRGEFEHLLVKGGERMTKQEGLYLDEEWEICCIKDTMSPAERCVLVGLKLEKVHA